jgi:hypothetical protein
MFVRIVFKLFYSPWKGFLPFPLDGYIGKLANAMARDFNFSSLSLSLSLSLSILESKLLKKMENIGHLISK